MRASWTCRHSRLWPDRDATERKKRAVVALALGDRDRAQRRGERETEGWNRVAAAARARVAGEEFYRGGDDQRPSHHGYGYVELRIKCRTKKKATGGYRSAFWASWAASGGKQTERRWASLLEDFQIFQGAKKNRET
jgi:hypothetical protein